MGVCTHELHKGLDLAKVGDFSHLQKIFKEDVDWAKRNFQVFEQRPNEWRPQRGYWGSRCQAAEWVICAEALYQHAVDRDLPGIRRQLGPN